MNRQARPASAYSKISAKSQTVLPREVRERLDLKPGDTLRYRLTDSGVLIDKAPTAEADHPFAANRTDAIANGTHCQQAFRANRQTRNVCKWGATETTIGREQRNEEGRSDAAQP